MIIRLPSSVLCPFILVVLGWVYCRRYLAHSALSAAVTVNTRSPGRGIVGFSSVDVAAGESQDFSEYTDVYDIYIISGDEKKIIRYVKIERELPN